MTPSAVDRRGLLGRYVDDAQCLRLFDAVMGHEAGQPAGAPAFIVEILACEAGSPPQRVVPPQFPPGVVPPEQPWTP